MARLFQPIFYTDDVGGVKVGLRSRMKFKKLLTTCIIGLKKNFDVKGVLLEKNFPMELKLIIGLQTTRNLVLNHGRIRRYLHGYLRDVHLEFYSPPITKMRQ